ncbi:DNA repair protein RadC [Enterococcus sp. 7E2_DIV0204]|uniref:DNA repair protein RadC n=2 Tax=Enterococcus TaxID=1350 RepID=A0ABZ2T9I5_9ENTE|nr:MULTISPECIES: DNA repair protein RadC [unclassified Enterococcus]OTN89445.1 DNA repair protein RadC [Enterococcus sp. 7E2_DIV0204]OTO68292.1 DNA repair protein RadC [Enterococcus sp. 12C11_DIV0727]OTP51899.1 DNA repair protein RadC [Enterococcus sp. 7D2_DIV0200]
MIKEEKLFIREMPEDCLPRERLEGVGEKALSNQELLAILLRTGSKNTNVMEVASKFLNYFNHLYELKNATLTEMMEIKGIGRIKAIELRAAIEFGYRIQQSTQLKLGKVSSSYQIAQNLIYELQDFQQEHLVCLYLNTKNEVIKQETVFKGSLNQSVAHPREIFRSAVKYSAARLILAHNHPSGNPTPSESDIHFTQRMQECGKMMGIEVLDHIIIGAQVYISMREENFFAAE